MLALGVNPFQLHFNPQHTKSSFPYFLHRNGDIRRQPILQLSNTFQIQKNTTKDFAQCSCRNCNVLKQFQNVMLCDAETGLDAALVTPSLRVTAQIS